MAFPLLSVVFLFPLLMALCLCLVKKDDVFKIKVFAATALTVTFALTLYAFFTYDLSTGGMQFTEEFLLVRDLGISYALGVDGISLPLLFLAQIIGLASIFSSWHVEERTKEFFILLLILIAGVSGTFLTRDLFIFLLCYEVVVIPIYIMVLVWGSTKRVSKEYAGMKLTIYLLLGSACLLIGVLMLYTSAYPLGERTFSLETLAQASSYLSADLQIFIFFFILVGFGSLLSMFPLHSWSPDGYAGAPTAVSMIHAGVLKKIGGYGLIRLGILVLPLGAKFFAPLIALLALANILYAALSALAQKDLKYIVGYSSVSHMGYVLLGLAALNVISVSGALANMVAHGVMAALFFSAIGYVYEKTHLRNVDELQGLGHQMPRVAIAFMLAGMSALGLPGLIGFVPEYTVFLGALEEFPFLTFLAISGVVFTAFYILRLLANVLFGRRLASLDAYRDQRGVEVLPLLLLGSVIILFGFFPDLFMGLIAKGVEPLGEVFNNMMGAEDIFGGVAR